MVVVVAILLNGIISTFIAFLNSLLTRFNRERQTWRCSHCLVHGSAVWAARDGPNGPRVILPLYVCDLLD